MGWNHRARAGAPAQRRPHRFDQHDLIEVMRAASG